MSNLLSYTGFVLLLAIMPGPDNVFVITQSLFNGWRTGICISAGLCSGVLVHTTAAASGISVVLYAYTPAFMAVKLIGAAYLFFLAYQAHREGAVALEGTSTASGSNLDVFGLLKKGFLMNVLNPKVSLFFVALLPQFVRPSGLAPFLQMVVLGGLFMLLSFLVFSMLAIACGLFSGILNSEKFWVYTKYLKIIVFVLIALKLTLG